MQKEKLKLETICRIVDNSEEGYTKFVGLEAAVSAAKARNDVPTELIRGLFNYGAKDVSLNCAVIEFLASREEYDREFVQKLLQNPDEKIHSVTIESFGRRDDFPLEVLRAQCEVPGPGSAAREAAIKVLNERGEVALWRDFEPENGVGFRQCRGSVVLEVEIPEDAHICSCYYGYRTNKIRVKTVHGDFFGEKVGVCKDLATKELQFYHEGDEEVFENFQLRRGSEGVDGFYFVPTVEEAQGSKGSFLS